MARNGILLFKIQARPGRELPSSLDVLDIEWGVIVKTVSVFLVLITSGLQYLVQNMNYKRDLARIDDVLQKARSAAWGNSLTPAQGQRKVRPWCHSAVRMSSGRSDSFSHTTGQSEPWWAATD